MAGRQLTPLDVNNRAAAVVEQVWSALDQCNQFYRWLSDATHTDVILTASPFSIPQADLDAIRPAITDVGNGLYRVSHGLQTQPATNDFFFNAKKLSGVNYTG